MAAGYVSQSNSKSLEFLEKGTSSLIESDGEDQSLFVEDLLFAILARFSEARQSLYESIRISKASGSGGDIHWSSPEKEWLFQCLILEIDDIPQGIVGIEDLSKLRSYLRNRSDAFPGALGSNVGVVERADLKDESNKAAKESLKPMSVVDVSVDAVEISPDSKIKQNVEKIPNYEGDLELMEEAAAEPLEKPSMNGIPKIPAIGEEWSAFAQTEGYDMGVGLPNYGEDYGGYDEPMAFGDIDDALIDSVGPIMESIDQDDSQERNEETLYNTTDGTTGNPFVEDSQTSREVEIVKDNEKTDFANATLVVDDEEEGINSQEEGSLDQFFSQTSEVCDIFNKFYADEDSMSLGTNEDKANWAAQDLYTLLQFTSVLKRVEAGRKYMGENNEDWLNATLIEDDDTETDVAFSSSIEVSTANNKTATLSTNRNCELAKYCSSRNSDGGLRSDLRHLRNMAEKNKQASERILAMMETDFTDRSVEVRGYGWLGNVLKFNEMKMIEWNDIIESKENFFYSHEGLEVLEDIVHSDWNELSDPSEMWDFDKNVDVHHRSFFADLVINRPDSESPDDFAHRYEAEWDVDSWEHEHDEEKKNYGDELDDGSGQQEYGADEFPEDHLDDNESDWSDHDI
jgi:hypothetical protein